MTLQVQLVLAMPGEAVVAASAMVADRYAIAATAAAREATRVARLVGPVSGQMAGVVATARHAAAAADAARCAADAARQAGALRAARRAEKSAQVAADWADMARHRAATSHYAPYTALKTAKYARRAATAARYAARASGPLGYCTSGAVSLAAALLPPASRDRYAGEWKSDLCHLPRRNRVRFMAGMLAGAVRLAVVLRQPAQRSGP